MLRTQSKNDPNARGTAGNAKTYEGQKVKPVLYVGVRQSINGKCGHVFRLKFKNGYDVGKSRSSNRAGRRSRRPNTLVPLQLKT